MLPSSPHHITLKVKVSLKAGFSVFRWTLVSYFFFLSGRRKTLTYGSEVPPMSRAGSSAACRTPTVSCGEGEAGQSWSAPATPPQRRAAGTWGQAGAGDRDGPHVHPQEFGITQGSLKLKGQLTCPRLAGRWAAAPAWTSSIPRVGVAARPAHRSAAQPSPTHLVGLEVVVQGKLQFAQVFRLLLLFSLPFSLRQARFCVVVILWGCGDRRDPLKGESRAAQAAWHRGSGGKPARLRAGCGEGTAGWAWALRDAALGLEDALVCVASPCQAQLCCCARCPRASWGGGVSLVSPALMPPPAQAPPTVGKPTRVWSRRPGAGEPAAEGREEMT